MYYIVLGRGRGYTTKLYGIIMGKVEQKGKVLVKGSRISPYTLGVRTLEGRERLPQY